MSRRWVIGVSSGSSVSGIDAALVEVEGAGRDLRLRLEHFHHQAYPRNLRDLLLRAGTANSPGPRQIAMLHRVLGESYAVAARLAAEQGKAPLPKIFCAGISGHTFGHDTEGRYPGTLSLGMAPVLAERTGLTVVSDFRSRDLAVGGQGFPLTLAVDCLLFGAAEPRVLIHLGGVATVLSLPAAVDIRQATGFQAAPCSILLDGLMRLLTGGREPYDAGGKHAVGCCIDGLLERWLAHPLLQRKPPKSMLRQEFGEEFLNHAVQYARQQRRSLHDVLCTATHFVAQAVVSSIRRFVPDQPQRILVSGGAARNGLLWRLLEQQLAPVPMEKIDAHGIPADARKAVAMAGLAALTMDGVPVNVPAATGASGQRLLGSITPGAGPNWARCLSWMAAQTRPLAQAA